MAKIQANDLKWGKMFAGEELVSMTIPKDKINPVKQHWLCINGEEIYLAVGKQLKVPQSVADAWNYSFEKTQEAEESITTNNEIQA